MRQFTTAVAILSLVAFAACKKKEDKKKDPPKGKPTTTAPKTPPKPKADPELVKKGAYLANVLACNVCHTELGPKGPNMAKAWGGGLKIKEPFGTWVSPNITPDPETGIGKWTDQQIIDSIRKGVTPNGKLKPIMPYMFYSQMTDDDAKALVAFMRTLKPVKNKVTKGDLKIPHIPAPPAKDYKGKRGEYLATLMHCAACHVPSNEKGEPDMTRPYAGGMKIEAPPQMGTGHIVTPNITSDEKTGIGKWTVEQIAAAIKTMKRPDGTSIGMPMTMYAAFWGQMTDEDITAVATFIKSVPPIVNKVEKSTFKPHPMGPPGGKPGAPGDKKAPAKKDDKPGKSAK